MTIKILMPDGDELPLFLDDVTNRILERYMPVRESRGLPACNDPQIIRGIADIVLHRLACEHGLASDYVDQDLAQAMNDLRPDDDDGEGEDKCANWRSLGDEPEHVAGCG